MKRFQIGNRVVKNPKSWVASEFDAWGAGSGIGVVVEPPFALAENTVDVRWPTGRCFESVDQLLLAEDDGA